MPSDLAMSSKILIIDFHKTQLTCLCFAVCSGLEWSNSMPDNAQLELCAGDPVKLRWQFNLSEGERLQGVQWIHVADDGQEEQLVASYEVNNFVPTAEFSGRVNHTGDGGVELSCATILDSGTYSVVVSTLGDVTSVSEHRRTVSVRVNGKILFLCMLIRFVCVSIKSSNRWA